MPRRQLAEAEVSEIEYAFNAFDFDGSGKIGYFELKEAVRALNLDLQEDKIVAALGEYGKDCYGKICCEEFKEIVSAQYTSRTLEEEVLQAFRVFDLDGSGKVSFRNLRAVTRRLGLHLSDVELRAMLTEFDSDQDGAVDETDFLRIARFGEDELD
uniref:Centrin-3 n=1 Tax=Tetraselmis sp. GSL018 TaxID=582737 RepID=A0A061RDQ4_9CHLO